MGRKHTHTHTRLSEFLRTVPETVTNSKVVQNASLSASKLIRWDSGTIPGTLRTATAQRTKRVQYVEYKGYNFTTSFPVSVDIIMCIVVLGR